MTLATKKRIHDFSASVLNGAEIIVDKFLYLNQEKTRRIVVGKTLADNRPALYFKAEIYNGSSWYTDQLCFAYDPAGVVKTLQKWWPWLR